MNTHTHTYIYIYIYIYIILHIITHTYIFLFFLYLWHSLNHGHSSGSPGLRSILVHRLDILIMLHIPSRPDLLWVATLQCNSPHSHWRLGLAHEVLLHIVKATQDRLLTTQAFSVHRKVSQRGTTMYWSMLNADCLYQCSINAYISISTGSSVSQAHARRAVSGILPTSDFRVLMVDVMSKLFPKRNRSSQERKNPNKFNVIHIHQAAPK